MYCELLPILNQDILVLTVNRRLSHHLQRQYAQYQIKQGQSAWATPAILPLQTWLITYWQHCRQAQGILLTEFQEQFLWQRIVRSSDTATLARQAWHLIQSWNLTLESNFRRGSRASQS